MEWQPIERWNGRYEVSAGGQVRRNDGLLLKQWSSEQGYMLVRLSQPRKVERIHRLVAEAFISNPNSLPFVNHINNDRADNRVSNLEWCTQWENLAHADRQGRMQRDYWVGKRSPNAKLTEEDVRSIRQRYARGGVSWERLGQDFGVQKRTIGRIIKREAYADVQ